MALARDLSTYTERQIANMAVADTPKGLDVTFTTDTENTLTFDNPTTWISFKATFDAWISFVPNGTASSGPQRFFWEANTRSDLSFGAFKSAMYVTNFTPAAGNGSTIHVIYRD